MPRRKGASDGGESGRQRTGGSSVEDDADAPRRLRSPPLLGVGDCGFGDGVPPFRGEDMVAKRVRENCEGCGTPHFASRGAAPRPGAMAADTHAEEALAKRMHARFTKVRASALADPGRTRGGGAKGRREPRPTAPACRLRGASSRSVGGMAAVSVLRRIGRVRRTAPGLRLAQSDEMLEHTKEGDRRVVCVRPRAALRRHRHRQPSPCVTSGVVLSMRGGGASVHVGSADRVRAPPSSLVRASRLHLVCDPCWGGAGSAPSTRRRGARWPCW